MAASQDVQKNSPLASTSSTGTKILLPPQSVQVAVTALSISS
jgi:hypothetical protein